MLCTNSKVDSDLQTNLQTYSQTAELNFSRDVFQHIFKAKPRLAGSSKPNSLLLEAKVKVKANALQG